MFLAIVPAYNEQQHIGSVVRSLFQHVDQVVVIDDCSEDATVEVAKAAGATVICHAINRGQGAALETGHDYARQIGADVILHFDGDGQFDVADIRPALEALKQSGADVLFGSRFLDNRTQIPAVKKYLLFPLARLFQRVWAETPLSDTHNGFRLLTSHALHQIFITQDRMAHAVEMPSLVARQRLRCIEFPVRVEYREYGLGMVGGVRIVKDLLVGRFVS